MRFAPFALASVVWVLGCGGSNDSQPPPQNPQQPPPNYYYPPPAAGAPGAAPAPMGSPPPATGMPPTAAGPGAAPPPGGAPPAGAATSPFPFPIPTGFGTPPPAPGGGGATGGTAQAIDPNFAGAATGALSMVAASETAGMQKEGPPLAGNFQEGQTLEGPITIQPGKCYTFVAAGVGVQELEITLLPVSPVPGMPTVGNMGSAKGSGAKTALGGGGNCIKLALVPIPVNAKWVLRASRGGGLVAGQAFVK